MKKKPLIGINCSTHFEKKDTYYRLDHLYVNAIRKAGGVPVLLPFFRSRSEAKGFLKELDGLLLTGGNDINPKHWGARKHPKSTLLYPEKEESDLLAASVAEKEKIPTLAICLGCQIVNVALGGTLEQHIRDIPGIIPEHQKNGTFHNVRVEKGSRLHEILGTTNPRVNSFHHQSVKKPARKLRVVANAPDGIVEGLEGRMSHFLVAVQWHPERMQKKKEQMRLFQALVSESR